MDGLLLAVFPAVLDTSDPTMVMLIAPVMDVPINESGFTEYSITIRPFPPDVGFPAAVVAPNPADPIPET